MDLFCSVWGKENGYPISWPPSMYHSAQSYAEPPAFSSSKLWRCDVGIARYEERQTMPKQILRFAQNDRKYAGAPQMHSPQGECICTPRVYI